MPDPAARVRQAVDADSAAVAKLLHDFNVEYDTPTPAVDTLTERVRRLLAGGDTVALLAGDGPDGLSVLRFRLSIWNEDQECYLAELYVTPPSRGRGLGRALMEASIATARARGAGSIDLGTSESDTEARALYERFGFVNRENGPHSPIMYVYELEL